SFRQPGNAVISRRDLDPPRQLPRKLLSTIDRLGCLSFRSAFASICRMRSRVTENCRPTSSSVWSLFIPMPKRMRSTRSSRGERGEYAGRGLAQVRLDRGVDRQHRVLILDEVAEVGILLVADRRFERERLLGDLESLAHLLERHAELFGKLLQRGLAADLVEHLPAGAHDLVDPLDPVHG